MSDDENEKDTLDEYFKYIEIAIEHEIDELLKEKGNQDIIN